MESSHMMQFDSSIRPNRKEHQAQIFTKGTKYSKHLVVIDLYDLWNKTIIWLSEMLTAM